MWPFLWLGAFDKRSAVAILAATEPTIDGVCVELGSDASPLCEEIVGGDAAVDGRGQRVGSAIVQALTRDAVHADTLSSERVDARINRLHGR